uniref:RxLR effector candidate protein n=1 Tax=Hyaloperonospora arabidopsidis (strain Emoy2) TaxID=559515 RepID=M4B667_HYAAE
MRDAIANLQSLYQRHGRVFFDGPSEPSDASRRTSGRDPQCQSSAGRREAPSCRATADSRASERDNSLDAPSCHGGSRYSLREGVDHHANPPMAVVGAGISTPNPLECRRRLVVSSNDYTICVIAPNKRGRSDSLWRRGCNASTFIDRTTDRSLRSTNWRTSGSVKPFATKWLTFVSSMRHYRARLRI